MRSYLALFHETTEPLLARVGSAIEARDAGELRGLAHKLKGSSGSIGARELAELGSRLEARSSEGDWPEIEGVYQQLRVSYERVKSFTAESTP